MKTPDLHDQDIPELLELYTAIMKELKARGVCRGMNNPVADYAESLVAKAVGATLRPPNSAGHDLVDEIGTRYEVKARRLVNQAGARELGALRALDECRFDFLAGVLFDENFCVYRAALVPWAVVRDHAVYVKYTNAWRFILTDDVWDLPGVTELDLSGHAPVAMPLKRLERQSTKQPSETRPADHDRTQFNLIGGPGRNLGKGRAMLALVRELVRRGVAPEAVVREIPRSERFLLCSVKGTLDSREFRSLTSTTSGGVKRYYVDDADLIHHGGRTYALTSQWTLELFRQARQSLASLCSAHGVSLEESKKG